ncbi:carboxymuconolactone decarboxylase family protein [Quisquiliibacterium transsilvanicum]|uniref:AhpD family alkylhydroperoxidase n=1 Tax=Quisquiliibacterium transsilvanicum TaxID=1549638 RepID=A0A7W8MAP9_9BURK|nr:carboxymuconolactone decarboxylase family protein [Quisquiliibacterium transsilvanicum]MBB5273344.1 AhpD family alkylhydroperoxidase [Quisquiliibacterium transsilvanicum]
MALWPKIEYGQANARVRAVYDDIRAARNTDYVNDIWKVPANDPALLERSWSQVKAVMGPGALDPLTKELVYVAVSMTNDCGYCVGTHTASARAKGMTDAQFGELLAVVGLANQLNKVAAGVQVELDEKYRSGGNPLTPPASTAAAR